MRTIVAWKPLNYEVRLRENKLRENHSGMETGLYFKNASRKSVA